MHLLSMTGTVMAAGAALVLVGADGASGRLSTQPFPLRHSSTRTAAPRVLANRPAVARSRGWNEGSNVLDISDLSALAPVPSLAVPSPAPQSGPVFPRLDMLIVTAPHEHCTCLQVPIPPGPFNHSPLPPGRKPFDPTVLLAGLSTPKTSAK